MVAPGAIKTDFSGGLVRDNPDFNRRVSEMTALGRAGVSDDIGPMIASPGIEEGRWINAQRIEVSGGWLFDDDDSRPAPLRRKSGPRVITDIGISNSATDYGPSI